jgi:hypothetical protein
MAYSAATELREYITPKSFILGQAVALVSYGAVLIGSELSKRRIKNARPPNYDIQRVFKGGFFLMVVGVIGQISFYGHDTVDLHTSAYWYDLYEVAYPGAAVCLAVLARYPAMRTRTRYAAVIGFTLFMISPFVLNARRGPLFPLVITCTFIPYLARRESPSRVAIASALVGVGAIMLAFLPIRHVMEVRDGYTYQYSLSKERADIWIEGLSELSFDNVFGSRTATLGDNEYAYHCGTITTLVETGRYQYGTGYLTLLTHWIPHELWPDKPSLQAGFYPSVYDVIPDVMGWGMTNGASAGGVANVVEQLGILFPLFWVVIAQFLDFLHKKCFAIDSLSNPVYFVGFLGGAHWLIAQGLGASLVPICFFVFPPFLVFRYAKRKSVRSRRSINWEPEASPAGGLPPTSHSKRLA